MIAGKMISNWNKIILLGRAHQNDSILSPVLMTSRNVPHSQYLQVLTLEYLLAPFEASDSYSPNHILLHSLPKNRIRIIQTYVTI